MEHIKRNVESLMQEIAAIAGSRAVTLVAVTKTVDEEAIRVAYAAGLRDFGENRAQDFAHKTRALADLTDVRWHFIGHLQTNKVRMVVGKAALIHSVDSARLLEAIDREAARQGTTARVLLQVNTSGEASKHGLSPEETRSLLAQAEAFESTRIEGLMTMAPWSDDENVVRPALAALRRLAQDLAGAGHRSFADAILSMGMTNDYAIALEEGSNMLRIGTRIFAPPT